jgi:hypothetical protein
MYSIFLLEYPLFVQFPFLSDVHTIQTFLFNFDWLKIDQSQFEGKSDEKEKESKKNKVPPSGEEKESKKKKNPPVNDWDSWDIEDVKKKFGIDRIYVNNDKFPIHLLVETDGFLASVKKGFFEISEVWRINLGEGNETMRVKFIDVIVTKTMSSFKLSSLMRVDSGRIRGEHYLEWTMSLILLENINFRLH